MTAVQAWLQRNEADARRRTRRRRLAGVSGRVGVDRCSAQSGTFGSDFLVELQGTRRINDKAFPHGDTD